MTKGITDLRQLERDAFRRFHEDGLFDIFLGAMFMVLGSSAMISSWLGDEFVSDVAMLTLGLIITVPLLLARRRLLRARLGVFRPGPARRRMIAGTRAVLLGSVVVGIIAFGLATAAYSGSVSVDIVEVLVPLLWFVNAVVVLGAMAYFLDVPRFYAYGLLFGLVMPLLVWPDVLWDLRIEHWLVFAIPGLAVIGVGLYKLRRFLRRYPAPQAS